MAYKRPLSLSQSICIGILWFLFFVLFCAKGKQTFFSWSAVIASGFIVFYPIVKSYRERQEQTKSKSQNKRGQKKINN